MGPHNKGYIYICRCRCKSRCRYRCPFERAPLKGNINLEVDLKGSLLEGDIGPYNKG